MNMRRCWLLIVLGTLAIFAAADAQPLPTQTPPAQPTPSASPELVRQFRKSVALAWVEPGRLVAVANGRSGSISLVDVAEKLVVGETNVGSRLTDLKRSADSSFFVALDDKSHELLHLKIAPEKTGSTGIEIIGRVRVGDDPRRVAIVDDGRTALVACRWSRRLDVVELRPADGSRDPAEWNRAFPRLVRSIALPFSPQELLPLPELDHVSDHSVVVVDAFGGRLAVVDVQAAKITAEHFVAGRNIRGLAVNKERGAFTVTFQQSDTKRPTTEENLREGKLAMNLVSEIPLVNLVVSSDSGVPVDNASTTVELDRYVADDAMLGAADPDDVILLADGRVVVLLAGVQQVAVVDEGPRSITRIDVGSRPTSALFDSATSRLIVANELDDTLSIVDLRAGNTIATFTLGPRPELWPRDRGERLFFDGRQSLGGFMSCHSCHTDGHTSGDLADTLGDNTYGTPKRIPTLLGISLTDLWGWNGELRELRDQVERSFQSSMHAPAHVPRDTDDMTAYLHTLPFVPPLRPQPVDDADAKLVAAGRAVFEAQRCAECHVPPLTFTSPATYDVGLRDERGLAKFNPPMLRGVGQGSSFFHDGRRKSLEELFRLERHSLDGPLSAPDLRALVRYLQGL